MYYMCGSLLSMKILLDVFPAYILMEFLFLDWYFIIRCSQQSFTVSIFIWQLCSTMFVDVCYGTSQER